MEAMAIPQIGGVVMKYWYYSFHIFDEDIEVHDFVSDSEYYEYLEEHQDEDDG